MATKFDVDSRKKGPAPQKPLPDDFLKRNELFDELWKEHTHKLGARERSPITITWKVVGSQKEETVDGKAWESTPGQMLKNVPKDVAGSIVVARVDDILWDLDRPLEMSSRVELVPFSDKDGRAVFWHSSAHVLGEACEHEYGCLLSHGPPTEMGFFYDMAIGSGEAVKETDWSSLETKAKAYSKDKQQFQRLDITKDNLRKMFAYSKYKLHYIEKFILDGESSTVYRNGSLVDLCQGPHIQNTRRIESFKIMKNSSAYLLGDQANDSLQRISGVAFPTKTGLKEWEMFLEEAKRRNHQVIGKDQKLWWFSQMSPGSPFYLPHGNRIWVAIQTLLREEYWDRGYNEVQSPTMYDVELWKQSGHWAHYQDDMFRLKIDDDSSTSAKVEIAGESPLGGTKVVPDNKDKGLFALKPMNCPGHALMFASEERSYRELPFRLADFSVLHRNEASGALSGMTRVRRFKQDDAHIFCTLEQVTEEIEGILDFMTTVYNLFGFEFKLKLSTRPEGYMGKIEEWNDAEARLKEVLTKFRGDNWTLNPGDGAFYGPKIDITISDALGREFQCATVQLDFQIAQNFKLAYRTAEGGETKGEGRDSKVNEGNAAPTEKAGDAGPGAGMARPVVVHRAIIGSFDRFLAIICEHFAGKWPFWLSPRQLMIIPVMKSAEEYCKEVQQIFHKAKMYVDVDFSGNTMQKKIRAAQLAQYNFVFVLGAQEQENRAINLRNRDDPETQKKGALMPLETALKRLKELKEERGLKNAIDMSA